MPLIGQTGKVRANIKVRNTHLRIGPRQRGSLGKIAIREQGSLVGDIKAAGISIDDWCATSRAASISYARRPKASDGSPPWSSPRPKETPKGQRASRVVQEPPGVLIGLASRRVLCHGLDGLGGLLPQFHNSLRWEARSTTARVWSLTFKRLRMMFTCHLTVALCKSAGHRRSLFRH